MSSIAERPSGITEHEAEQIERSNVSGRIPVVFIHGLWLLPSSWDRWAAVFEEAGFTAVKPGWPDDPETVADAKAHPEVFAGKKVGQVADHIDAVIRGLSTKPAVIGHSFGGLLTQIIAGRGPSFAAVCSAGDAELRADSRSRSTARKGAGSIATDANDRPRRAMIWVSKPPNE